MNFDEIISDYKKRHLNNLESEINSFIGLDSNQRKRLAFCQDKKGRKFPHQYRIKKDSLNKSYDKIQNMKFENFADFDSLYAYLENELRPISGIGDVYIYDTALRLSKHLNFEPNKIYLHAGSKMGAKNLGLDVSKRTLPLNVLPQEFQAISPKFVEAILCLYKGCFITN